MFCCNKQCQSKELTALIKAKGERSIFFRSPDTVIVNNERYIFIVNINKKPECLYGLFINSYRICSNQKPLSEVVLGYLRTHTCVGAVTQW